MYVRQLQLQCYNRLKDIPENQVYMDIDVYILMHILMCRYIYIYVRQLRLACYNRRTGILEDIFTYIHVYIYSYTHIYMNVYICILINVLIDI